MVEGGVRRTGGIRGVGTDGGVMRVRGGQEWWEGDEGSWDGKNGRNCGRGLRIRGMAGMVSAARLARDAASVG